MFDLILTWFCHRRDSQQFRRPTKRFLILKRGQRTTKLKIPRLELLDLEEVEVEEDLSFVAVEA